MEHVTKILTDKDIENYREEKKKSGALSQKGSYEDNRPILIESDAGLGIFVSNS